MQFQFFSVFSILALATFVSAAPIPAPIPLIRRDQSSPLVTRFITRELPVSFKERVARDVDSFFKLFRREPEREDIFAARELEDPIYLAVRGNPPPEVLVAREQGNADKTA